MPFNLHSFACFQFSFRLAVFISLLSFYLCDALTNEAQLWPARNHNVKDEELRKRELRVRERMALQAPIAVRKMSGDEGEKFFLDYWEFGDDGKNDHGLASSLARSRFSMKMSPDNMTQTRGGNTTSSFHGDHISLDQDPYHVYSPAIAVHGQQWSWAGSLIARNLLGKRQYQCPQGTDECSDIQRSDNCCAIGESCVIVEDSGIGDVGCCPEGASCAGGVSDCDEDAGFSDCPNSPSGGCCIPGYQCQDEGCVVVDTLVVIPTPTVRPSTSTSRRSASTTTTTLAPSSSSSSITSSTTSTSRQTTTSITSSPISVTVTTTAAAPLRPTAAATTPSDFCPTGFYACSAIYHGGCCRIDRNCDSTSCPPPPSNTVVAANGITILASDGIDAAEAFATGDCASGWITCGADDGGGCCPSGFECGENCVARVTETAGGDDNLEVAAETVAKIGPENSAAAAAKMPLGLCDDLLVRTVLVGAGWILLLSMFI